MNKTMKRNVVVSAILAIMLCISLITGATFALFTSESKVNIAVTSGKVDVRAYIDETTLSLYSPKGINAVTGEITDDTNAATNVAFYNGGTATLSDNTLTLDKISAGDEVTFDIVVTNYSNITAKFKTTYTAEGDSELIEELDVYAGETQGYVQLNAAAEGGTVVNTLHCYVKLPTTATAQGKTASISFAVNAVQGNADVDMDDSVIYISTAEELVAFAESHDPNPLAGAYNYIGKTVYLTNDIDLTGTAFKGIGYDKNASDGFAGTFDGQGHTVRGIDFANEDNSGEDAAGFINVLYIGGTVRNLTIEGATIKSAKYVGGIAGYCYQNATIENCNVVNSTIVSYAKNYNGTYDNGNNAGGIAGVLQNGGKVDRCTVENTTIQAYRDLGGIVGKTMYARETATVSNCQIKENVTVIVDRSHNYDNKAATAEAHNARNYIGRNLTSTDESTCTGEATILCADYYISTAEELFAFAENVASTNYYYNNKVVMLTADIDLNGRTWTPVGNTDVPFAGTFDGNGHTIKNFVISEENMTNVAKHDAVAFFGWVGIQGGATGYVKNVTIDNATVSGHRRVAALVGYLQFGEVTNCTVKNSTITATHKDDDRCGDKAGAVIGFVAPNGANAVVSNCSAEKCTVKAARDAGQVIGMASTANANNAVDVASLSATDVTVLEVENNTCNDSGAGNNINNSLVGRTR